MKHIAIAGNIGAGKTTLCELLSKHFGWEVRYEDATTNPYLSDFITICLVGLLIYRYIF